MVKHEAYAVRKSNCRSVPAPFGDGDGEAFAPDGRAWTDERAERYERLRIGAEAMATLKPHEIRCLLLRAEGLSYNEISDATGWSYTKVNRCITEGRRAFLKRVASIETGVECERLAPLISKVVDGEASADEMRMVRPHLKGCLACKATLREYRAAPARLAGLVPPVVALAGGPSGGGNGFVIRTLQALGDRFGAFADTAGAQKAAAIAATAALLAGGGAAGVEAIHHDPPRVAPSAFERAAPAVAQGSAAAPAPASSEPTASPAPFVPTATAFTKPAAETPARDPQPEPEPQSEFDPGTSTSLPVTPPPARPASPASRRPSKGAGSSAGSPEFTP